MKTSSLLATVSLAAAAVSLTGNLFAQVSTGPAAFADYTQQQPGAHRKITVTDLPLPKPEEAVNATPKVIERPADAWPIAPAGFKVTLYAGGDAPPMQRADNTQNMKSVGGTFTMPRLIRTAPNGDLFLADSGSGKIIIMRGVKADGKAELLETFAEGLDHPFGIAFYPADKPRYVYVGNATSIVRFPYVDGDTKASGAAQTVVDQIPGYAQLTGGGHWTRDVVFSKDGTKMLISVGSGSNISNPDEDNDRSGDGKNPKEFHRANVLEYTPEGKFLEVYASGIRNCVGEAINPVTGSLWCSVNERDNLGNHLVPDYVTSVPEHSFFGWPWYYMGGHQDPRLPQPCADGTAANPQAPTESPDPKTCKHVDLSAKVRTPDVLVQPHMASLEMTFYPGMARSVRCLPRLRRRRLRRRARLLESRRPRRLRGHPHPHEERQSRRRLRRLPHRLRHQGRPGLGPPRRRHDRQRRQHVRHRRRHPLRLARHLRRKNRSEDRRPVSSFIDIAATPTRPSFWQSQNLRIGRCGGQSPSAPFIAPLSHAMSGFSESDLLPKSPLHLAIRIRLPNPALLRHPLQRILLTQTLAHHQGLNSLTNRHRRNLRDRLSQRQQQNHLPTHHIPRRKLRHHLQPQTRAETPHAAWSTPRATTTLCAPPNTATTSPNASRIRCGVS